MVSQNDQHGFDTKMDVPYGQSVDGHAPEVVPIPKETSFEVSDLTPQDVAPQTRPDGKAYPV